MLCPFWSYSKVQASECAHDIEVWVQEAWYS